MYGVAKVVLIGLCALVLVLVGGVMFASASHSSSVYDHIDDSTTVSYNEEELEHYQPKLVTQHLDVTPTAVYGMKAQSTDSEYVVYAYWVKYPIQAGGTSADSHIGDREPIYVFVNPSDGSVDDVLFSKYHYLKGSQSDSIAVENGSPVLHVNAPYHHYEAVSENDSDSYYKSQPTLKPFVAEDPDNSEVQFWADNGWSEVNFEVVMNPHEMQNAESWWEDESAIHYKTSENFWQIYEPVDSFLDSIPVVGDFL